MDEDLRLAEVLAALSVATDLGMGQQPEKAIRSCLLATELARASDLPETQVRDVYYTSLLHHLGCTATGHELAWLFGDDVGVLSVAEHTDDTSLRGSLELLGLAGRGTGLRRVRHVTRMLTAGSEAGNELMRSTCEVGARMAERLRLGDGVWTGLRDSTETWDGSSGAFGRTGEQIALPARFSLLATQAVIYDRLAGPEAAVELVRGRAAHWFDPELAALFVRVGPDLLGRMADADVWSEVVAVEPLPVRRIPTSQVDDIARVFADVADLKCTYTLGHSAAVADLAVDSARTVGLAKDRVEVLRRAGLLHDLGRIAVSSAVWEQERPLTSTQWEQVRLHSYHTERILSRSTVLAPAARIAGMHHERQDGSGYHHGVAGAAIPTEARLLATADAFQAMTQARPHRPALAPEAAARALEVDASEGRLDGDCVRAVVEAAGLRPTARTGTWPAGLSDREVDVLRLVARGSSNRGIADALVISPRTAEHHVQNIYAKIGGSTRAAAAVFAMEHGLVR